MSVAPRALARTFLLREAADLVQRFVADVDPPGHGLAERARGLVAAMAAARGRRPADVLDDVPDPIGWPVEVHQEVGEAIAAALIPVLARIASLGRDAEGPAHHPSTAWGRSSR